MKIYFLFRIIQNYLKIFLGLRALHIMMHTPVLDLTFQYKGALEPLTKIGKFWPPEESKGSYIHPEYRKRCNDSLPANYRSKQNTVTGVLYCHGLNFHSLALKVSRKTKLPIQSTGEVSLKADKWAGWEVCWRQACNNILHNTISKVLKTLNKSFGFEMPLT